MPVDVIVEQLRSEEEKLKQSVENLSLQVKDHEAKLKRVQTALAALDQKSNVKTSRKQTKPAATKNDVIAVIESALGECSVLPTDELRTVVETRIADTGKSKQGLALRFAEALQESKFTESPDGYRLASAEDSTQESSSTHA